MTQLLFCSIYLVYHVYKDFCVQGMFIRPMKIYDIQTSNFHIDIIKFGLTVAIISKILLPQK